jgi:hypothetical protein
VASYRPIVRNPPNRLAESAKVSGRHAEQTIIAQAAKGTLTAPGCPTGKAKFEVYGPITSTSVFASLDFACTTK